MDLELSEIAAALVTLLLVVRESYAQYDHRRRARGEKRTRRQDRRRG